MVFWIRRGLQVLGERGRLMRRRVVLWYGALPIRMKLILSTGILVVGLMTILSLLLLQQGNKLLRDRLGETCSLSLRHVSQAIKNDLLPYYLAVDDINNGSLYAGHIRETIHDVLNEEIDGLVYACVIDRYGLIIAHTDRHMINHKISVSDSLFFAVAQQTVARETGDIIEYIHPLFARREGSQSERVFLGVTVLGFSKKIIFNPIHRATQAIITLSSIVILFSVALIFFFARRMTGQIDALSEGVRRVSRGNLNVQIQVLTHDELGQLAREFNSMIVHLREKLQMQKFVSKLTVQMIKKRSTARDLLPVGERRGVTLLFSDVRNFSSLTEQLTPEEIIELINIYLDIQSRVIEENNGVVDKYMGDQIMAIFQGENMADNAVHAAVQIQRSIRELNKRRRRNGEVVLTVGCGLHIGSVVMGNMGSKNRMDYTVIGDIVNLASRLCAVAKPGQIIAPIEMVDKLDGEYPTIRLNPIRVKGRRQIVEIFEVDYDRAIIM
ncbi:HAMP domain-containing protein [candidate division KSB1 bacterium]|nr:HAMP domain-containing protein [candidate division KSB1 bacterium]